jgi:hypothetical protein
MALSRLLDRGPDNKRFVASWLASEMWVNVGLLIGGTTLILAGVLYLLYPGLGKG